MEKTTGFSIGVAFTPTGQPLYDFILAPGIVMRFDDAQIEAFGAAIAEVRRRATRHPEYRPRPADHRVRLSGVSMDASGLPESAFLVPLDDDDANRFTDRL